MLEPYGFSAAALASIESLLESDRTISGKKFESPTHELTTERTNLCIRPISADKSSVLEHGSDGLFADAVMEVRGPGIYNFNGYHSAGINSIAENSFISISVYNGEIVIKADKDGVISIISADGRSRNVSISSGVNYINNMPRGFYIIKGDGNLTKKVLL
jgi:hypothetical protein